MLGFETIGSATIIAYDDVPVLTTDAWVNDSAYFGSWTHDYEIPAQQLDAIRRAKFHWFSHGHPDHLNVDSIPLLTQGTFLLSDHVGQRIYREMIAGGHTVRILPDRKWVVLSPRIKVCSFTNQNQDSVLLIDVNGHLVIDANDSPNFGAAWHIRRMAKAYKSVFHCQLHGWGGADMLNLFDPGGSSLTHLAAQRRPIAPRAQRAAMQHGATHVIPFSSFHRYQREDSIWANALVPELQDYQSEASPRGPQMLPAFVRVDCVNGEIQKIEPRRKDIVVKTVESCGDDWSESLEREDAPFIDRYFKEREHLAKSFGFIEVTSGGRSHRVDLNPQLAERGVSFECPRQSLMTAIRYEVFDDLLIGNFMKTTLHGVKSLYPDFSPYVAKYADNGGAKSEKELAVYFHHYVMRDPIGILMTRFATSTEQLVRHFVGEDTAVFRLAKRVYYSLAAKH